MSLTRILAIALRIFYLYRGSPARLAPLVIWVVVDILMWGFLTRYLDSVAKASFDFMPALLGAVLLWDFLTRVMQGVTMAFFEDVWSRNFLNLFATPLSVVEYLVGLVLCATTTSLVSMAAMLIFARVGFGLSLIGLGVPLAPFVATLFVTGIALGVAAAALVLRLGPAAEWLVWPIPMVLAPFAGVFYPISSLPLPLQAFARLLPPSYVFEGMRAVVRGEPPNWDLLAAGAALSLAYLALAGWFFSRVFAHVIRNGLLARYSAETAG
jgi:ABC-2 type transport system permease protein